MISAAHGYQVDPEAGLVIGLRGRPVGSVDSTGYLQVDGRSRGLGMMSCHRIIWVAVYGPIPVDREINHKNGVKTDNRIDNLEITDRSGNLRHAFAMGLKSNVGERHPTSILTDDQVRSIRRTYVRLSRDANLRALAAEYGVSITTIFDVVSGHTWTHVAETVS